MLFLGCRAWSEGERKKEGVKGRGEITGGNDVRGDCGVSFGSHLEDVFFELILHPFPLGWVVRIPFPS